MLQPCKDFKFPNRQIAKFQISRCIKTACFLKKAEVCEKYPQKFTFDGNFPKLIYKSAVRQWQELSE